MSDDEASFLPPVHRRVEWTDLLLEDDAITLPAWFPGVSIDEAVASAVADHDDEAGFSLALLPLGVGLEDGTGPPLHLGVFGHGERPPGEVTRRPDGRVDVDLGRLDGSHRALALRIVARGRVRLRRVTLVVTSRRLADRRREGAVPPSPRLAPIRHSHPFFSQLDGPPELRRRICSPTALAMVLAFHGVVTDPVELAHRVRDPVHGIYGNWARAVYVAGLHGLDGRVDRLRDWRQVARILEEVGPVVARIRVEAGQLPGAPYERTDGHLVVVSGLDGEGGVIVSDPAACEEPSGRTVHPLERFARVWFGTGGTSYVLFRPDEGAT